MVYKVVGILIIVAASVLAFFAFNTENNQQDSSCIQLTPAQQLSLMINKDFQTLIETQKLPPEWNSIATVEVQMNSPLARALLGNERPHIQRVKDGTTYLELQFMDLPDEEDPGIIIQASLFDIKTKNKIFEIGRTYRMNELNKKTRSVSRPGFK